MLGFDITIRDLGGLTVFALALGGVMGFIVRAWLKKNLTGIFVEHTDLAKVQTAVDGVKVEVGSLSTRVEGLAKDVAALPTHGEMKDMRHNVAGLAAAFPALGAKVDGQAELLRGIQELQQMILDTMIKGGK